MVEAVGAIELLLRDRQYAVKALEVYWPGGKLASLARDSGRRKFHESNIASYDLALAELGHQQ